MRRDLLQRVLKRQREALKAEWDELYGDGKTVLRRLRDGILSGEYTPEDVEKAIASLPRDLGRLFWFIFGVYGVKGHGAVNIDTPEFREFIETVSKAKNYEGIKESFFRASHLKYVGVTMLSTWAAIIREDMFMPVWEGILGKKQREALGIKRRFVGSESDPGYYLEVVKEIRDVASELGIESMLEVAFYLSKYSSANEEVAKALGIGPPLEIPEVPRDLAVLYMHLLAGKNLIIYGPPGCGKTRLAKRLAEELCGDGGYDLVTANAEWTIYDTVGGERIIGAESHALKRGFFLNAVFECFRRLKEIEKPYWLIIDEINRTNLDIALGRAFTLLDPSHRETTDLIRREELSRRAWEELRKDFPVDLESGIPVPYSFRVVATMNSYDRALLFKLGFALLRRFAVVEMRRRRELAETNDGFEKATKELAAQGKGDELDIAVVSDELLLAREELNDFALIKREYYDKLREKGVEGVLKELEERVGFPVDKFIEAFRTEANYKLEEKLGSRRVELTVALSADVLKFVVASYLLLGPEEAAKRLRGILDEAIAAYFVPQLDVLAEDVSAELMGVRRREGSAKEAVQALIELVKELGFERTQELLRRLERGEHVI